MYKTSRLCSENFRSPDFEKIKFLNEKIKKNWRILWKAPVGVCSTVGLFRMGHWEMCWIMYRSFTPAFQNVGKSQFWDEFFERKNKGIWWKDPPGIVVRKVCTKFHPNWALGWLSLKSWICKNESFEGKNKNFWFSG